MTFTLTDMPAAPAAPAEFDVLAFLLNAEEYRSDILRGQELHGYESVANIATTPGYIKGGISLDGQIVPIIDLRIRLNPAPSPYGHFTVAVILAYANRTIGMVVDLVSAGKASARFSSIT